MIKTRGDQETIFKLGAKTLATLIALRDSKYMEASYCVIYLFTRKFGNFFAFFH